MERTPRPRINRDQGTPVGADPDAFIANLASSKAKKILDNNLQIRFEVFFDKHLKNRQQFGDEQGERPGISDVKILELISKCIPHLVYFGLKVEKFSALTYDNRILIKDGTNDTDPLNLIIEVHSKDSEKIIYEITVITAMCVKDFKVKDKQYLIEMINDEEAHLKLFIRGKMEIVCTS